MRGQRSEIPESGVHGGFWGETRRGCVIARMYEYSVKTEREKKRIQKEMGVRRNVRAVCEMACSCYLHRGHDKAASCDVANHREKG